MKKYLFLLMTLIAFVATSCKENDGVTNEYDNWQERNQEYFKSVYANANSGKAGWKILNKWSKNDSIIAKPYDQIVIEVLNEGKGTECPLYTDSVRIHYEGRLMPTSLNPEGLVFDCSWTGKYNPNSMVPYKSVASAFIDGFTTALMHMHVGDRWRVYIPQQLGYGSSASGSIPAYSTLIFDLTLHSYGHPGTPMPTFK